MAKITSSNTILNTPDKNTRDKFEEYKLSVNSAHDDIAAEVTNRVNAIAGEVTNRTNAIAAETSNRQSAIQSVQAQVVGGQSLGAWNAATNTPTLSATPATVGKYYEVNVAGTSSIPTGGSIDYKPNDRLLSNGTIWQHIPFTDAKIATWIAGAYPDKAQVNYLGKDWQANVATLSTDIPGTSAKWVERLTAYNTDAIKTAIGTSPVTETATLNPNTFHIGSGGVDVGIWENQWAATSRNYDSFDISFFRWSGTAAVEVYIHTGSIFTLAQSITPLDVATLQKFTVNVPVPAGSIICLSGNIGYRSGGGVGLKKYNKTTFGLESTLAGFELSYKLDFTVTYSQLKTVASQVATVSTDLATFKGTFGTGIELETKTNTPNTALAAGSLADSTLIWENQWSATIKTYQYFYVSFIRNAGVNPVLVYIHTGSTFTLVATLTPLDVATVQTFKVVAPVPAGSNICLNGNIGYASGGGVGLKSYSKTTFAPNSTLAAFEIKYSVQLVNESTVIVDRKTLSIKSSDKVLFIGNSYTEGGWQLRMKHFTNNISMLSDFLTVGYGTGGYNLQQIYDQFNTDTALQSWPKPSEMDISYAVIALLANNTNTGDEYFNILAKLCDKLESMGIQPILSSEHFGVNAGTGKYLMALADFANKRNYLFINWGNFALKTRAIGFNPFQYPPANHIGTRPYWLWADQLLPYLSQLTVKKSLKIFRQRTGTDFTTLPTFIDNCERAKYFEELEIGTKAHALAEEKYFDRQNNTGLMTSIGGTYTGTKNDYNNLINTNAVSFGSYALASIMLEYWDLSSAILNITATGITNVYIKLYNNTWTEVAYSSAIDLKAYIGSGYGRKFTLLFKGSSISITDINVVYTGYNPVAAKQIVKPVKLTNSLFTDVLTGVNWTIGAGVTDYVPVVDPSNSGEIEELPIGITVVKELNTIGEYVSTPFTPAGTSTDEVKAQIRVLCRNFPTFIDTDAKFSTSAITSSSYDLAKIKITVSQGGNSYIHYRYVGLWWNEVTLDTLLYGGTSATIRVESADSNNLQIASIGGYY